MHTITSRQNPIIKQTKALHGKKARQALSLHFIEGEKLLLEAHAAGVRFATVFTLDDARVPNGLREEAPVYVVTQPVMEALCDTVTPQGLCAVVHTPVPGEHYPAGMLLGLDALQDPGNLGMILRTADAMGAAGVLLGEGCADPYAPKCIRAAMGSTYHMPIWQVNLKETLQTLHKDGYCCMCGHLQGEEQLPPFTDRCVIVIGNEGNGVHEDIAALCFGVRLPMYGKAQSLNASMAAGLLMYEVAKSMHTKR